MIDLYTLLSIIHPYNPHLTPKPEDFHSDKYGKYGKFLDFNTKDEYLAWRDEWRRVYAELSKEIRSLRMTWRAEGSNHSYESNHAYHSRRALARALLSLRKASKERAERLYQASKEASRVA